MAIGLGTAITLGTSLIGGISGLFQRRKANRLERQNVRPTRTTSSAILENRLLARQLSNQGMSRQAYQNQMRQIGLGLTTSLRSNMLYGRGVSNTASILRGYSGAISNLNAQDEQIRQQNQRLAFSANQALAQEEQRNFEWNKARPYLETAQRVESLRRSGNQNMIGALGLLGQSAMMGVFDRGSGNGMVGAENLNVRGWNPSQSNWRPSAVGLGI